jgi:hypothetical protein
MSRDEALDILVNELPEWPVSMAHTIGLSIDGWAWGTGLRGIVLIDSQILCGDPICEVNYIARKQQRADARMDNIASNGNNGDHYEDKSIENSDSGAHYRYEYKGIKLDPYRILDVYGITSAPQQHAIKKLLRAGDSVKGKEEDIKEVIDTLNRWLDMLAEDNEVVNDGS